jgi:hypothetical protein
MPLGRWLTILGPVLLMGSLVPLGTPPAAETSSEGWVQLLFPH